MVALCAAAVAGTGVLLVVLARQPPPPERGQTEHSGNLGAPAGAPEPDDGATPGDVVGRPEDTDFQALAEAAMRIQDPVRRQAELARILGEWLQMDPPGFGKYVMALEVENEKTKLGLLASALSSALATLAPDVIASPSVREAVHRVVLHLARHDPDTALEWAEAWLADDGRESAMVQIARAFSQRSPEEGVWLATRLTSPLRRMQAFAVVGGVWARSDAGAAVAWASQLPGPTEQAMALNAVLTSTAQSDPQSAGTRLATAERLLADQYRVARERDLAAMNVTEADLANDPETYKEMMEAGAISPPTSPDVELLAEAARVIASKLAAERGSAGTDWAQSLESAFLQLQALKGAVAGWSGSEPGAAADFVAASYGKYPELLTTVFDVWAGSDPASAAAGTRSLENAALRSVATEAVVTAWALTEPARAAAWVDGLPEVDRSDAVRLALVSGLSTVNPVEAWQRAQAIQDPSVQYRGLKAAFAEVVVRSPEVARELLVSANLTGRTAERLQDILAAAEPG